MEEFPKDDASKELSDKVKEQMESNKKSALEEKEFGRANGYETRFITMNDDISPQGVQRAQDMVKLAMEMGGRTTFDFRTNTDHMTADEATIL